MTNAERQYMEAVKASVKGGKIDMMFRMKLHKLQKDIALSDGVAKEIESKVLEEAAAAAPAQAVEFSALAAAKAKENAEREERKRLADLERQQEEARREAQRLEAAKRRAEEDAKRESEKAEEARKRREEEEAKDRERREKEHQQQLAEQERLRKETEKAAEAKLAAEKAMREAAEAKAAAELAKKEAELKASQAKMQSQLSEQQEELARVKAAVAGSPQKRWLFIVLGLVFGVLGVHLAYAKRWILFGVLWLSMIMCFTFMDTSKSENPEPNSQTTQEVATGEVTKTTASASDDKGGASTESKGNDAIAVPCLLVWFGLWFGGTFFIKKDGKKRRLS